MEKMKKGWNIIDPQTTPDGDRRVVHETPGSLGKIHTYSDVT